MAYNYCVLYLRSSYILGQFVAIYKKNGFSITFYTIVLLRKLEYADMFRPFLRCSMCFSGSI